MTDGTSNIQVLTASPVAPESVEELDVPKSLLEELLLKILHFSGPLSLPEWGNLAHLKPLVVDELFRRLRKEQLCEVTGMSGHSYLAAITSQGRSRALELLSHNQYVGPAPVSVKNYVRQVRSQSVSKLEVRPTAVQRAFSHLVLHHETLTHLGTALNSGAAIVLYGPSGSGKTAIAEALPRVFAEDGVWIPYAVEVDGQIITMYDPLVHREMLSAQVHDSDPRWVLCHRPTIVVGGELTIEMLDLQFNPVTKFCSAPVQMKANNGVLIIDDFGRQRVRPDELLNRWVVPLDRKMDFLTLPGGKKIEIPFELFVVFATNINLAEMVDVAFLRRIQTKIKIDTASEDQFQEIFRRVCHDAGVEYNESLVTELMDWLQNRLKEPLRPCYPRDLINQVCWAARYEGRKPQLDRISLLRAVESYFLADRIPDRQSH